MIKRRNLRLMALQNLGFLVLRNEGFADRLLESRLQHLLVLEMYDVSLSLEFRLMVKQETESIEDHLTRHVNADSVEALVFVVVENGE